jgi:hypothetical protein
MREKIEAIQSLLAAAKEENEYGGSEDADGCLHPGNVDWDELEERIICVLEDREHIPPKPSTPPQPQLPGLLDEHLGSTTWLPLPELNKE